MAQFIYFPQLPTELRLAIWQLCLPHRIVELDVPFSDYLNTYCQLGLTSYLNSLPPVITRVCRESRQVAFENHSSQSDDETPGAPGWVATNILTDQWFNPRTDIVHLNWHPLYDIDFDSSGNPIPFFLWEAAAANGRKGAASITADLVHAFEGDDGIERDRVDDDIFRLLDEGRKDYLVCLKMVCLHVPLDQAVQSDLFGRLGEERVRLVDAFDKETIRKFDLLWSQGPQRDVEPAAFFENVRHATMPPDRESFYDRVRKWSADIQKIWVAMKWFRTRRGQDWTAYPLGEDIWLGHYERTSPFKNYWGFTIRQCTPNQDHPWVRGVLDSMPEFRPMIMFRLCEQECYLPQKPKSPPRRGQVRRRPRGR